MLVLTYQQPLINATHVLSTGISTNVDASTDWSQTDDDMIIDAVEPTQPHIGTDFPTLLADGDRFTAHLYMRIELQLN